MIPSNKGDDRFGLFFPQRLAKLTLEAAVCEGFPFPLARKRSGSKWESFGTPDLNFRTKNCRK
jgi:hypothetical protein